MPTWSQGLKQFLTANNGKPLVGGKLYTYAAGTNTPKAVYKDALFTIPHTNPVILDSRGEELIYWNGLYKVVATYSNDRKIWTADNVNGTGIVLSTPDTVELPPIANFTYAPASPEAPATITATNTSSRLNGTESYLWTVDGIDVATTANTFFALLTPGDHVVSMRVSNGFGEDTKTVVVAVVPGVPPPPPDVTDIIHDAPPTLAIGQLVSMSEVHTGIVTSWDWLFTIDGAFSGSSSLAAPIMQFNNVGVARAQVTVTGPGGSDTYGPEDIATVTSGGGGAALTETGTGATITETGTGATITET